ncbi:molybdate ABC transporter ATP-binding protein ModF [Geomonas silvestris]|uniref:Molybdate ABC transporter ATP-binding protein ModF n=1 Tax=Geomonas silvestris TaxID=2740184 RepID=A0A6V8MND8_9BACT|nr:molybdate ABC transporter ATP-binding protein ModF [Geomonas silvestris]GFO61565.1 molybdate ABC transporter ATP-binding protein ModF [Geomonas silvestris]
MSQISFDNVTAVINDYIRLENVTLTLRPDEQWAIVGANGSGKSTFGKLLCNNLKVVTGSCQTALRPAFVSFEKLNEVLEEERYNDDSDFIGKVDEGTIVTDFILGVHPLACDREKLQVLAQDLAFTTILPRGLKYLSTGEMRKVLICKALMQDPDLLVLDEPFDGLDRQSVLVLNELISKSIGNGLRVILLLNRFSEIVPETTHIAYVKDCRILMSGPKDELLNSEALRRFHAFHYTLPPQLPEIDPSTEIAPLPEILPLIEMRDVVVRYDEKYVLNGLSWTVSRGEHWKISGPNGAGKSTLLNLIGGDNPQAYANDITLFGIRKGSGESVWDIKRRIGLVSTGFQQDYRVGVTVKIVVISGIFDSIGVYHDYSKRQQEIALEWLKMLHMEKHLDTPFRNLSYGEQRLVLLARAMVKQPDLLILDEPCQGLDDVNREMVLKLVDHLGKTGRSQILYVTHHQEDKIPCILNHLELVPAQGGGFTSNISVEEL